MGKYLCEWKSKDIDKRFDELKVIIEKPEFVCKKCARCSNSKKALCKPVEL